MQKGHRTSIAIIVVLVLISVFGFIVSRNERAKCNTRYTEFYAERERVLDSIKIAYTVHTDSIQVYKDSLFLLNTRIQDAEQAAARSERKYNSIKPIEQPSELAKSLQEIADQGIN